MIAIDDSTTIAAAFFEATERYASNSLLAVPANPSRGYDPAGREITYAEAADAVRRLMAQYRAAGYGLGHRVGLFLESRPEHMLHKLALNTLGVCCVPINPDYRPRELAYVVDHAKVDLIVALTSRQDAVQAALAATPSMCAITSPSCAAIAVAIATDSNTSPPGELMCRCTVFPDADLSASTIICAETPNHASITS